MTRHDEVRLAKALLDGDGAGGLSGANGGASARRRDVWHALELPEPAPPPPPFAARVATRARQESTLMPGFALAPRWASLTAALLVVLGAAGGAGLGAYALAEESADAAELELFSDDALLDDYLSVAVADEPAVSPAPATESEP